MRITLSFLLLLLLASPGVGAESPTSTARWVEATYEPSDEPLTNPERGLYVELADRRGRPLEVERLQSLREQRITLVQRLYYLKDYRDRPLDERQLSLIRQDFQSLREAGMKVILRFAYSSQIGEPDAPLPVVLNHIEQLKPLLRDNAGLILTFQAGFIGAWGEWHASTNGLTEPDAMREIAFALLEALPTDRTIQVRTPKQKQLLLGSTDPLSIDQLARETRAARIGHHNDCFLADASDVGTYRDRSLDVDREYVADDSLFVPVGGETCRNNSRSDPAFAREELARMHWSFLNLAYHRGVIRKWRESAFLEEVQEHLGYRLRLERVRLAATVEAGDRLSGQIDIRNDGWAAPINPRPLLLTLSPDSDGPPIQVEVTTDVRNWFPGETHTAPVDVVIPAKTPAGSYTVHLTLPDASAKLANDPRYSIRLANVDVPSEPNRSHDLGLTIEVQQSGKD